MLKTNSGLQQHIYQEQSILIKQSRAPENATEWKLNPALFHKIVEQFGKPDKISLMLELISNWIDMCLGIQKPEAMAIEAFSLTWNNNDFYMFHL